MTDNEKKFFAQYLEYVTERTANKQPEEKVAELAAKDKLVRGFDEFRQRSGSQYPTGSRFVILDRCFAPREKVVDVGICWHDVGRVTGGI